MLDLKTALLRGADVIDAREAFDPQERAQYLNASEAMTCIRKQWYQKHGAEKDGPENWGYARRGKHAERYIVERLTAANIPMLFTGGDQVQIVDEELRISCTPDGLIEVDEGTGVYWAGVEFKSSDPRTNFAKLPKDEHVVQLQIAMAMFEKYRAEFPELGDVPIREGYLLYINCSDFNDIHTFKVPVAPKILDRLKGRAARALDIKDAGRLPREGKETPFQQECKTRCMFNKVCGVAGAGSSTAQGKAGGADLSVQRSAYLRGKDMEAQGKAAKEAAGELLKAALKKAGVTNMVVDEGAVSVSSRAGSISYARMVKDLLPDADVEPYRGAASDTLTVK